MLRHDSKPQHKITMDWATSWKDSNEMPLLYSPWEQSTVSSQILCACFTGFWGGGGIVTTFHSGEGQHKR